MDERNENKTQELNRKYFDAFIHTRGSVCMLKMAWAGLVIACLDLIPIYGDAAAFDVDFWSVKVNILLVLVVIFMMFCSILSLWNWFLFKYQNFVAILLTCYTIVLTFSLSFLCLLMVQHREGMKWFWVNIYNKAFIMIMSGIYLISLVYNVIWIKKQLKNGFSEERANKNYLASKIFESDSMWIIFGCTMFGSIIAGIWEKIFGYALGILFVCVFSRLTIETGYSTFLRIKDKSYWEEVPEKPILTKKERQSIRKKWYKRINVVACVGIVARLGQLAEKQKVMQWQTNVGRIAFF